MSDETLISLSNTGPVLHSFACQKVVRLSRSLALKTGIDILPSEAEHMRFAATNTNIPMPKVHRSFNIDATGGLHGTRGYIVLDYVEGECLADCWSSLDTHTRRNVVLQVASIIQEMQSVQIDRPGPIGGATALGMWFTEFGAGPFENRAQLEAWFNHKLKVSQKPNWASKDVASFSLPKFVLTHQDISPRNLILDGSGTVWVIDWAHAGAYPPFLERATLIKQMQFPDFNAQVLEEIADFPTGTTHLFHIWYGICIASFA